MDETVKNPKDALGSKKAGLSCCPSQPVMEAGLAMLSGALKYGRHNWRHTSVMASIYYDAALRHLMAWWEGEDPDPESGISHLAHAVASLLILRDADMQGTLRDNRPANGAPLWQTQMNAEAKRLVEERFAKAAEDR